MEMGSDAVAKNGSEPDPIFSLIVPIFRSAENIEDLIVAIGALVPGSPANVKLYLSMTAPPIFPVNYF
jgi:hypothetical protein